MKYLLPIKRWWQRRKDFAQPRLWTPWYISLERENGDRVGVGFAVVVMVRGDTLFVQAHSCVWPHSERYVASILRFTTREVRTPIELTTTTGICTTVDQPITLYEKS